MDHKVYSIVGGVRVCIGEVFGFTADGSKQEYSIQLTHIPLDGRLVIEFQTLTESASGCVLRVRNTYAEALNGHDPPRIAALKAYRDVAGCGLGEAKMWFDGQTPIEQPGLGPWGRSAWEYSLPQHIATSLMRRDPSRLTSGPDESAGTDFPAWEVLFR